ncbi:2-C-methyl-D-erythritol 4-phosphate cytidylyltransferase [Reinekea sp.]|jgi:2-C-methyl-D-erythritol 4-phosphate cytidylyltransferase|uniref:2-C-methyl-D-erythritol 4-phosphate cytidylyltransferase n=1 Tax=Reinekea sp. TaxID=1970455 RepID=UPI003989B8AB
MTVHVVFPSAGVGSRFGADIPKQFVKIAGRTIMEWTLLAWQNAPIDGLRILVKSKDDAHSNQILKQFDGQFQSVLGGKERSDSVLNALSYLRKHGKADDWVMVHDIARPCVSQSDIQALLNACLKNNQGAILAKPISDTVKQQIAGQVVSTLDRSTLWSALTPQCFKLAQLSDALESALAKGLTITDEASAIEQAGLPVQLIEGSADNIKLTRAEDAELVHFYLKKQKRISNV